MKDFVALSTKYATRYAELMERFPERLSKPKFNAFCTLPQEVVAKFTSESIDFEAVGELFSLWTEIQNLQINPLLPEGRPITPHGHNDGLFVIGQIVQSKSSKDAVFEAVGNSFAISETELMTAYHNCYTGKTPHNLRVSKMVVALSHNFASEMNDECFASVTITACDFYEDWAILKIDDSRCKIPGFYHLIVAESELPRPKETVAIRDWGIGLFNVASTTMMRIYSTSMYVFHYESRCAADLAPTKPTRSRATTNNPPPSEIKIVERSKSGAHSGSMDPIIIKPTHSTSFDSTCDTVVASQGRFAGSCGAPYFAEGKKCIITV